MCDFHNSNNAFKHSVIQGKAHTNNTISGRSQWHEGEGKACFCLLNRHRQTGWKRHHHCLCSPTRFSILSGLHAYIQKEKQPNWKRPQSTGCLVFINYCHNVAKGTVPRYIEEYNKQTGTGEIWWQFADQIELLQMWYLDKIHLKIKNNNLISLGGNHTFPCEFYLK